MDHPHLGAIGCVTYLVAWPIADQVRARRSDLMMVLVSYDVAQDDNGKRRLRKVAKVCQNYGQRVQYSVFECLIDPAQWAAMRSQLLKSIIPEHDSLRFYFLGASWQRRVEHVGAKSTYDPEGPMIA